MAETLLSRLLLWQLGGFAILAAIVPADAVRLVVPMGAVMLGGTALLVRRWSAHVDALTAAARRHAAGELHVRFDAAHAAPEFRALAVALNAACERGAGAALRQSCFSSDASHELRTPLAVIRGNAELALSRPRSRSEYREALAETLRSAERMSVLLERLLLLARMDAGGPGIRREIVDWDAVVTEAAHQLAPQAESRGVSLSLDLEPCCVAGDATVLAQIAANYIQNAIAHSRPGGNVRIRLRRVRRTVTLAVLDNGPGIAHEHRPQLFERFSRIGGGHSQTRRGCGLGLALCKAIAAAHGGEVGMDSEPGHGSTFWAKLPAAEPTAATTALRSIRTARERRPPAAWTTSRGTARESASSTGSIAEPAA